MATGTKAKRSKGRNSVQFARARERILKHNRICHICGNIIDLDLKWPHAESPTVDHIIPVSKLSWNDPLTYSVENLLPAHLVCNQRRGAGDPKPTKHKTSRDWLA